MTCFDCFDCAGGVAGCYVFRLFRFMSDPIHDGAQEAIDRDCAGWAVTHYVTILGLTRLDDDGQIESSVCLYCAEGQPAYTTDGLIWRGQSILEGVDEEAD